MRALLACLVLSLLPSLAMAQEDDRGTLTAFLEDNLSGAGRAITITGFEGALSSRATIERLQIADDTGVWITLDDVVLDWSQSSLLSGVVTVNELSAATITMDRVPSMSAADSGPSPEASGFALPELPVSIEIGSIVADRIVLGEAVLGEAVQGRFEANLTLADGIGDAGLVLERTDGPVSRITLRAAYSNATGALSLDLSAVEEAGGIAARMLDLPGEPSVDLSISGEGPLSDFVAEVLLTSDGVERLSGPVTIARDTPDSHRFSARLSGNLAPLFLPDYAAFLGEQVALDLSGTRWRSGRVVLNQLAMKARALTLSGSATVAGDGLPEAFALTGQIGLDDGQPVLLPLPGPAETRVRSAELTLQFDATKGNGWVGEARLIGLERPDLALGRAELTGSGRIGRVGDVRSVGATLKFLADGLALKDAALQEAVGPALSGTAILHWRDGTDALSLPRLTLTGQDYSATAGLQIEGLTTGFLTTGDISIAAEDLARFASLTGLPLAGSADIRLSGEASRLTGAFDVSLEAETLGLRLGVPQADRLLSGAARLSASARRDESGTTLRAADLTAKGLALTGSGKVSSNGSDLTGRLTLATLKDLDPAYGGAFEADARFTGTLTNGVVTVTGNGRGLTLGQPEIDRLIAGSTAVNLVLALTNGVATLTEGNLTGPNLTAEATGQTGSNVLQLSGRIRDLALIAPEFPGPVTLSGQVTPGASGSTVDVRLLGPAGIDATVKGRLSNGSADLTLTGSSNAALANAVADPLTLAGALQADLQLRGPIALTSLSGRVTLSGGRLAYPLRGLSLDRTEVVADLSQGSARISATADVVAGGRIRVAGTIGLDARFDAALDLILEGIRLRDPELYDTTASGQLRLDGPLLGRALLAGRIALGETNLIVPASGFASASDLAAIDHINDSAEVRATRARAGLNGSTAGAGSGTGSGGPDWALDLLIDAPNRVFLRGRGLDAELGGSVLLGGTLGAIVPSGSIDLIRGRLDLLGKRLALSEASLVLEGDLVPYLIVTASNETDGVISTVTIEGPANAPEVTFSSSPELPQEEVLAWLLFGRGLESISALQAAELANAVAVLAGRGGEGIISKLRKSFGFDDLDFSTAEDGTASLSAGKYISENVYTEFEVDQTGKSQINLNLDLGKGATVKGKVGSDGQSGIGIFLEGDY